MFNSFADAPTSPLSNRATRGPRFARCRTSATMSTVRQVCPRCYLLSPASARRGNETVSDAPPPPENAISLTDDAAASQTEIGSFYNSSFSACEDARGYISRDQLMFHRFRSAAERRCINTPTLLHPLSHPVCLPVGYQCGAVIRHESREGHTSLAN